MKKVLAVVLCLTACVGLFAGCGSKSGSSDSNTIVIGASPSPHADILKAAEDELEKEGYKIKTVSSSNLL